MIPYPFDFGDDDTNIYTLQEVFRRLYEEYKVAEKALVEKQDNEKEKLYKEYLETDKLSIPNSMILIRSGMKLWQRVN